MFLSSASCCNKLTEPKEGNHQNLQSITGARGFPRDSVVKNLPVQEMLNRSLGLEDPLEKEMATQSSILYGKSHGQQSLVWAIVHRVAKSWTQLSTHTQ